MPKADAIEAEGDVQEGLPAVSADLFPNGFVARVERHDGLAVVVRASAWRETGRGAEATRAPDAGTASGPCSSRSASVRPRRSSSTRYGPCSLRPTSNSVTMFGWESRAAA